MVRTGEAKAAFSKFSKVQMEKWHYDNDTGPEYFG
jgi:hypothetical protein